MPPGPSLIGRTLAGRFRITGFLGEGAMAAVYRGEQDAAPRELAIKVVHAHLARDPVIVRRFKREAKAAALLKHPNTVSVVAYGVEGPLAYMVMDLLRGRDLHQVLADEGPLAEARAVRVLFEVCRALQAAHGRGIVHRDLKPENVMLVPDARLPFGERVKVLDFGIMKVLDRAYVDDEETRVTSTGLTTMGSVVGTPAYMSPEQCQGIPVDPRSDVYACGLLLYQLVTGEPPFQSDDPVELMKAQIFAAPLPPSDLRPGLDPRLEALALKALAKSPKDRHESAVALRAALADLYAALGGPTHGPEASAISQVRPALVLGGSYGPPRPPPGPALGISQPREAPPAPAPPASSIAQWPPFPGGFRDPPPPSPVELPISQAGPPIADLPSFTVPAAPVFGPPPPLLAPPRAAAASRPALLFLLYVVVLPLLLLVGLGLALYLSRGRPLPGG
jgi:serine/threonine-protein kinase